MAKAKKLKSGSWRCQVYDYTDINGKRHYRSFTSSDPSPKGKREAEFMAAEFAANKNTKIKESKESTFGDALDKYIETKEPVLSPSTIRGYNNIRRILKKQYPNFCNKKLYDITQDNIQSVISDIARTKAPKTVRNYHGLISAIMGGIIPLKTSMPQRIRPDLYIPSDSEIQRLMTAVRDTEIEIPVMLAAFCLMRRGEICGLSMNDINGNIIHIHHSLVQGKDGALHLKAPKTVSSDRYIEAPSFVIDRIHEVGHITKVKPHTITVMFQKILKRNNIPSFRFHDLRHYSASIRHALGIPDAYIMADGGWSSDNVLKSVYRHTMSDRKKEMSDKAISHFNDIMQHEMQHKK